MLKFNIISKILYLKYKKKQFLYYHDVLMYIYNAKISYFPTDGRGLLFWWKTYWLHRLQQLPLLLR